MESKYYLYLEQSNASGRSREGNLFGKNHHEDRTNVAPRQTLRRCFTSPTGFLVDRNPTRSPNASKPIEVSGFKEYPSDFKEHYSPTAGRNLVRNSPNFDSPSPRSRRKGVHSIYTDQRSPTIIDGTARMSFGKCTTNSSPLESGKRETEVLFQRAKTHSFNEMDRKANRSLISQQQANKKNMSDENTKNSFGELEAEQSNEQDKNSISHIQQHANKKSMSVKNSFGELEDELIYIKPHADIKDRKMDRIDIEKITHNVLEDHMSREKLDSTKPRTRLCKEISNTIREELQLHMRERKIVVTSFITSRNLSGIHVAVKSQTVCGHDDCLTTAFEFNGTLIWVTIMVADID